MANRITQAIARTKQRITERLASGAVTQTKLDELNKTNDMAIDEFCKFQELKSLAFAQGKLTLEESQLVYNYLGGTPNHFNGQPLEVKVVLTQLFGELLKVAA